MTMAAVRKFRRVLVGAALLAFAAVPGCDWLESSGPGPRESPFLSALTVESATGVACGPENAYQITFRYSDAQDDIFKVRLTFTHLASGAKIEEQPLWTTFDLSSSPGRAITDHFFPCGSPTGRWKLAVEAEDAEGHRSNELTETIVLNP